MKIFNEFWYACIYIHECIYHLERWTFATTVPWRWSWSVARVQPALRLRQRRKGRPPTRRVWRVWSWRRTRRVWRNNHIWAGDWDKLKSWKLNKSMWHQGIFGRVHEHPRKLWYGLGLGVSDVKIRWCYTKRWWFRNAEKGISIHPELTLANYIHPLKTYMAPENRNPWKKKIPVRNHHF